MPSLYLLLILLVASSTLILATQPSSTPCANYVCPATDQLGFGVGDNSDTNGQLFCSYPAVSGEDPNDFFCRYNDNTGALTQDNDAGLCEPTATSNGNSCTKKRQRQLERALMEEEDRLERERSISEETVERRKKREGLKKRGRKGKQRKVKRKGMGMGMSREEGVQEIRRREERVKEAKKEKAKRQARERIAIHL